MEELELCNKMMKICQESKHKFRLGIIAFFIIFSNEINEICEDFDYIKDYMATSNLFNIIWTLITCNIDIYMVFQVSYGENSTHIGLKIPTENKTLN